MRRARSALEMAIAGAVRMAYSTKRASSPTAAARTARSSAMPGRLRLSRRSMASRIVPPPIVRTGEKLRRMKGSPGPATIGRFMRNWTICVELPRSSPDSSG